MPNYIPFVALPEYVPECSKYSNAGLPAVPGMKYNKFGPQGPQFSTDPKYWENQEREFYLSAMNAGSQGVKGPIGIQGPVGPQGSLGVQGVRKSQINPELANAWGAINHAFNQMIRVHNNDPLLMHVANTLRECSNAIVAYSTGEGESTNEKDKAKEGFDPAIFVASL